MSIKKYIDWLICRRVFYASVLSLMAIALAAGCSFSPVAVSPEAAPELTIRNIEPLGQVGHYLVSGEAPSLNGATVTVAAVREFESSGGANATPNYSLLDRQFALVSDGAWQTKLQIWQTDSLVSPQELWQIDQATLGMTLAPVPEVEFMVTLDPVQAQSWAIAQQMASAVQRTDDGDVYLVARSTVSIPVPASVAVDRLDDTAVARRISDRKAASVAPSGSAVDDIGQSAAVSRTTLPISPKQYLR